MSPYQQIFSANAVLNVWRNLRSTSRDQNDLLLTFQYQPGESRTTSRNLGKGTVIETTSEDVGSGRGRGRDAAVADGGRSIGFVVPWRSMQAQRLELKEKEKELAEALVVLSGEVAFTEIPPSLFPALTANPLIQIRHLAAGLSRQMSKIELQMADNAPFCTGKNLYTGGELIRKFLPPIQALFEQRPVPQRMIFELLMELKDLVYFGVMECDKEVLEWELNAFGSLEDMDEAVAKSMTPTASDDMSTNVHSEPGVKPLPKRKPSVSILASSLSASASLIPAKQELFLTSPTEILYHLESLETTSAALTHLPIPITDFLAKSAITIRRMLDRRTLNDFAMEREKRDGRCADYARCMKWAGTSWRQGGGCGRGCKNEDEDPEGLPCWHRSSKHFDERGAYMVGGGKPEDGTRKTAW